MLLYISGLYAYGILNITIRTTSKVKPYNRVTKWAYIVRQSTIKFVWEKHIEVMNYLGLNFYSFLIVKLVINQSNKLIFIILF